MNEEIKLKKFVMVVLGSLFDLYDNFLISLNVRSVDDFDWENVKGLLIEEYMKCFGKNEKEEFDNVFFVSEGKLFYYGNF